MVASNINLVGPAEIRGQRIRLKAMGLKEAERLAELLSSDRQLIKDQIGSSKPTTPEEVLETEKLWREQKQTISFVITIDAGLVIGQISLSHINQETRAARCGYFLAGGQRRKGYASEAFGLILSLAANLQLCKLSSKIDPANEASLRIWRRYGAEFGPEAEGKILTSIDLSRALLPQPKPEIVWHDKQM